MPKLQAVSLTGTLRGGCWGLGTSPQWLHLQGEAQPHEPHLAGDVAASGGQLCTPLAPLVAAWVQQTPPQPTPPSRNDQHT